MANPYVNKVVQSNGTTLIDISDTTAVASDVASGKYFYLATGEKVEGTAGGGGQRTTIVPEQTVTVSGYYASLTYVAPLVVGETYIYTINGNENTGNAVSMYGSIYLGNSTTGYFEFYNNQMYLNLEDTSLSPGTYTVKIEQESGGGGGGSTLIEKTITANGTYDAEDDDADGYSKVPDTLSSGTSKNTQVVQGTTRTTSSSLTAIGAELTVSKTGTYDIYWSGIRTNTSASYTFATQLYIDGTAYGSENSTWTNHVQNNHLTNVSLTSGQKLRVYGRESRGSSYYMYAPTLVIVEA